MLPLDSLSCHHLFRPLSVAQMVSLKAPISIPTDGILEIQLSNSSLVAIVKGPCMLTQWNAGFSSNDTFTHVANVCAAGYKVTYFAYIL